NALRRTGISVDLASNAVPVLSQARPVGLPTIQLGVPFELNHYALQRSLLAPGSPVSEIHESFIYQRLSVHNFAGVSLSRRWSVPLVVEYNGSELWLADHWGRGLRYRELARRAEESMLRHAHLIVTVSAALRDDLLHRGVEPSRIVCYPN